jgi:hypothetical protein
LAADFVLELENSQEEKLKATERYQEVKEEIAVSLLDYNVLSLTRKLVVCSFRKILLAALVHSLESFRTLSRPIRLSSSNGFYLECSASCKLVLLETSQLEFIFSTFRTRTGCVRAGKLGRAWVWTKRGQTI